MDFTLMWAAGPRVFPGTDRATAHHLLIEWDFRKDYLGKRGIGCSTGQAEIPGLGDVDTKLPGLAPAQLKLPVETFRCPESP